MTLQKLTTYGILHVADREYVLLRPVPFEPENYFTWRNAGAVWFYVAYQRGVTIHTPHTIAVSGNWSIDMYFAPKQEDVDIPDMSENKP